MNTIDTLFEWLLAATLRASVLAVVILGIQWVLRRWLPAGWRHALWLPMLAGLVLPALPEAPFGLFPGSAVQPVGTAANIGVSLDLAGSSDRAASAVATVPAATMNPAPVAANRVATNTLAGSSDRAAPATGPGALWNSFAFAWFTGACGVLAAGGIGYRRNLRRIQLHASLPDRTLQAAIDDAAGEAGLKRAPQTIISPVVASPAVTGLLRPRLLLPAGFPEGFNAAETRLILLHEFTHLKRLDLPLNWLMCVLQAMHWFNPLLWFAFARIRTDREAACDACVLSIDTTDRRAEYGGALLKLQCTTPARVLSLGFVGIFERGSEIQSRIRGISAHRPGRTAGRVTGGALVTLLMVFGVTKGQQTTERPGQKNTQAEVPAESPVASSKSFEELRKAIKEQEDKVEERRKVLATIVRTKGIIYMGEDAFHGQEKVDADQGAKAGLQTFLQLEQEKMQLESQFSNLLKYNGDPLMVFAAGLSLPDNVVKNLYPQYLEAKRQLETLKVNGIGENHPTFRAKVEQISSLQKQLDEGVVDLRATLQAKLELGTERLKRSKIMMEKSREEAIKRGLDAQDYVDVQRDFETDAALLQQMKLKLLEETIRERNPSDTPAHTKQPGSSLTFPKDASSEKVARVLDACKAAGLSDVSVHFTDNPAAASQPEKAAEEVDSSMKTTLAAVFDALKKSDAQALAANMPGLSREEAAAMVQRIASQWGDLSKLMIAEEFPAQLDKGDMKVIADWGTKATSTGKWLNLRSDAAPGRWLRVGLLYAKNNTQPRQLLAVEWPASAK